MSQHKNHNTEPLGRGLETLFGNQDLISSIESQDGITNISINLLESGRMQPRKVFDEQELSDLSESIKENGILQPIIIRKTTKQDKYNNYLYEIIAGERRWRAAKKINLKTIPVIVKDITDKQALVSGIIENVQRHDLNAIEEANGYAKLIEEFGYTQEKISQIIGKSRSHIANILRLITLPKSAQLLLVNGKISAGHARALINCKQIDLVLQAIVRDNLSVRQTESMVSSLQNKAQPINNKSKLDITDNKVSSSVIKLDKGMEINEDISNIERDITRILKMQTKITLNKDNSGEIKVYFDDLDGLDNFMNGFLKI